jgi:Tol biopolymer transport system component
VAFESLASDLVTNDTNRGFDVFVRDLQTGNTTQASVNRAGTDSGNDNSGSPVLSADGRFVAFASSATDLVPTHILGGRGPNVFVRDLQTGTTTLASVNLAGTDGGNGGSVAPVISADGRFVAFESFASDLVANDTNGTDDVFVQDLLMGTTTLVSVNRAGTGSGNNRSGTPLLSATGRFVAFVSEASDLVPNDGNGTWDVFVRDVQIGTTTLVSVNQGGTDSGNRASGNDTVRRDFKLSPDGRFVVFASLASDLVATDTNGVDDVFIRDLQAGTTVLVSVNGAGTNSGNRLSVLPSVSADGRFVAFQSNASDLVANDTNGTADVFVRDLQTGTTTLVSVNRTGTNSGNHLSFLMPSPLFSSISTDGRFVAFMSQSSDLVMTDTNAGFPTLDGQGDVFVRDLQTGTTTLVSVNREGTDSGNVGSEWLSLSADGRFVAFQSSASDLVATDTNGTIDVFVRPVGE